MEGYGMIAENARMAISSMAANRLRTFLSLLGIIIGVASVVTILNLGRSVSESISEAFEVGGLDTINVMPMGSARETLIFTEEFAYDLMNEIDGIREVLPTVSSYANLRNRQETVEDVQVQGVTSGYFSSNALEVSEGEFFSAIDNINRRQVCIIGKELAEELFPEGDAVGSYVSVFRQQAKSFLVVGVLEERDDSLGASYNTALFMPYNTYVQRFRRTDQVGTYVVKVAEGYDATVAADDIEQYLDEIAGEDYYRIFSPATVKEMSDSVMSAFSMFLAAIAAISLIVGGIGIMNIMMVYRNHEHNDGFRCRENRRDRDTQGLGRNGEGHPFPVPYGVCCPVGIRRSYRACCRYRDIISCRRDCGMVPSCFRGRCRLFPDLSASHRNILRLVSGGKSCKTAAYGSISA